ncbi:hypothetical protein ASC97_29180 [Rhizobium sp. Root1203]|nr:hypothetical protein ASC97_29180 [Rhizobium sp. Root1203]
MAENMVTQKELEWRTARGAEHRQRTDVVVKELRESVAPREELDRIFVTQEQWQQKLQDVSTVWNRTVPVSSRRHTRLLLPISRLKDRSIRQPLLFLRTSSALFYEPDTSWNSVNGQHYEAQPSTADLGKVTGLQGAFIGNRGGSATVQSAPDVVR